ncbi:MAG: hypothetical protein GSR86_00145, partial [Desulfurococcales archaeon]|nr:hypothetical protein [Desulfurococcales archaeon]
DGSIAQLRVFPVKGGALVVGVVLLLLGLLFLAIGILPFVIGGSLSTVPIPVRIIFAFFGFIAVTGGYYQAKYAAQVASSPPPALHVLLWDIYWIAWWL